MSKLDETLQARETCRTRVLDLKKELAAKAADIKRIEAELAEAKRACTSEQRRLGDLTSAVAALLHADLAGIVGGNAAGDAEPNVAAGQAIFFTGGG